jgi:hypothetical protein
MKTFFGVRVRARSCLEQDAEMLNLVRRIRAPFAVIAAFSTIALLGFGSSKVGAWHEASTMPDLSGLAWIKDDLFIAVHDAKNFEKNKPRVSILRLWRPLSGISYKPVKLHWPGSQGPSNDLESIAHIPGTGQLLLVESGDDRSPYCRIFLANLHWPRLEIASFIKWPTPIYNVEGTAVARISRRLIFIYAERAEGKPHTAIRWADLEVGPTRIGAFREVPFTSPDPTGPNTRQVSAIEVDSTGKLYIASTFDPGDDNGPFRSVVWQIGQVELSEDGKSQVVLSQNPLRVGTLDGLKAESVAIRKQAGSGADIFFGVDDENYGGTIRLIPPQKAHKGHDKRS